LDATVVYHKLAKSRHRSYPQRSKIMELRHLRDFVAVVEEGTFTRAATKLHVTQPCLTRQIKNLEEELGVPLLIRSARGVSLTPQGESFLSNAKRVLSITAESMQALQNMSPKIRPQLNIGYMSALYCDPLARSLADFRSSHPNTGVNLFQMTPAEQLVSLQDRKLDFGYLGPDCENLGAMLQHECIATHDVFVAMSATNPLSRKEQLALEDLNSSLVVGLPTAIWPGWREWMQDAYGGAASCPPVLHQAQDELAALRLVALGVGITFLPEQIKMNNHVGVAFRPLSPRIRIRSSVAWNTHNDSNDLKEYIRIVRQFSKARFA
jgi:DNA-binding transcriptional LysR family regulator